MQRSDKPLADSPFREREADASPGFLLFKLTGRWQARLGVVFDRFGITQTQYAILASLLWFEEQGRPPTQSNLVAHARIDKMTLSKAVRRLEADGAVERAADPSDQRAVSVRLTAAGRARVRQAIRAVEAVDHDFFGQLSPAQLRQWMAATLALTERDD